MSVLQIDYYKNGQFKGASGASIFQSSNSQSSIAFKFEDDIEDAIVFANILLPYPENSQLYGQYKAQSLIMEKKVDPNGGYIYIGQLLAQYLQTNGKAYVNAQIQASEGLYKFQNDTTQPQYITLAGVVYEISTNTVTIDGHSVDLLVLTNNLTGEVYNQVNAGVITVKNVIYKITEFDADNDILKMESGFAVDNYQRVEFKITASAPYYAAMPMTPEESIIFADAIAKNQYDIVNLQQEKQDKEDPTINPDTNPGDDNDHTVVGNINTLLGDTAQNTGDIGALQGEMSQAQQDIHDLQVLVGYGVNIVGEMTTIDALPTDAQVSVFVTAQTGEAPVRGEAVIVRVDYTAGTDTIYLYVFNGTIWKHFEMQFLNDAGNGIKGLIEGNYNAGDLSTPGKFMVNISNGIIVDIVRVDSVGNIVTLKDALDLIIAKVLDTSTGAVNRAKMDANGNNIASTYMTKQEGVSKDYVKDYASPKALYDLNYPDYALGQFKSVEVSDTSYNKTTNSTSVGYTTLATITKSLEADILLGDQNGLVNRLWISANITEDVKLRITTAYIDGNNQTQTLSVEETDTFGLVTGIAKLLQIESVFSGLTQPITLPAGTTLVQTIEVWREASASVDFTLLSNTTYNAYMTLNKIGYVRYSLEQEPSAIETGHDSTPTIDSDGDLLVQSTDGKMHYANGGEQEIATILKVPMASGINANDVRPPKAGDVKTALDNGLGTKQDKIDSTHKLSADLVDDSTATNKFVTATEKSQITTNKNDITALRNQILNVDGSTWVGTLTDDKMALLMASPKPILYYVNHYFAPIGQINYEQEPEKYYFIELNKPSSSGWANAIVVNTTLKTKTYTALSLEVISNLQTQINTKADISVAGQEYDPTRTYNQYDTCRHNGKAYYCYPAATATGTWDSTKWTEFNMGQLFGVTRDLDNTKYVKPSGGIPKTDLASGVQTSLGKADSAYQKPSSGIPASDLASAVQTSLGKADTAVQPSTLTTWTELTVTASPNNFIGNVSNFSYNCRVNTTLRLLNISFRAYMNVSARTGIGQSGITLTISGFTFPQYIQVRGSSQMTKLNSLEEDSSVAGAGRGVYFETTANSNQLTMLSNESYTNVSEGIYFVNQNIMIPY